MALEDDAILSLLSEPSGLSDNPEQLYENDKTRKEGYTISTLLSTSKASGEKPDETSLEDSAWADSCLVINSDQSEDTWNALMEALLETLTSQTSSSERPSMAYYDDIAVSHEYVLDNDEEETSAMHTEEQMAANILKDDGANAGAANGDAESDVKNSLYADEFRESREDIFQVWDLQRVDEEDESELIQQLNKLLLESNGKPHLKLDNLSTTLGEDKVDEIVTGMADLSL